MNYYEILKVPKNATNEQIKSSYKNLVKQYHPDLYTGNKDFADQKIKQINEAYDILSNPEKKLAYDEYLNPSISYPATHISYNAKNETNSSSKSSEISNFLRKLIIEKINQLDTKHQLQILIFILIVFLALFLLNLIQVQYYLTNQNNKQTQSSDTSKEEEIFYDGKTLDDLFLEQFAPYYSEEFEKIYKNEISL